MTNTQKAHRVRRLLKALERKRGEYQTAIDVVVAELEELSGLELISNDFPGDGLGVGIDKGGIPTYIGAGDLLAIIEEKGTFTKDDIITYL